MELAIQPVDQRSTHVSHVAAPTVTSQTAAESSAPSFSAVFASIAAAAAAAGTTVASTASPTGGPPIPVTTATTPASATPALAATADDPAGPLFGANPWLTDPTGSGPGPVTNYNPIYFATQQTAQTVAQMVGGTVVSMNEFTTAPGSPFQQNQPNLMVQLPDGGLINPGLVADIYTHGWSQSFVNQQVANEVAGAPPATGTVST